MQTTSTVINSAVSAAQKVVNDTAFSPDLSLAPSMVR